MSKLLKSHAVGSLEIKNQRNSAENLTKHGGFVSEPSPESFQ